MSMCKENLYAKMEKLEAHICRRTRQGLLSYALFQTSQKISIKYSEWGGFEQQKS